MVPRQGVLGSNHINALKSIQKSYSSNHLAQMLENCDVALPSGLLPSLLK